MAWACWMGRVVACLVVGVLAASLFLSDARVFPFHSAFSSPGTLRVPQDFPSIQGAINASSPGDTVIVDAGTYFESLTITKPLILTGASRDTTIIDTRELGPGISINNTSGVVVSGFTVRGTGFFYDGIDIVRSSGVVVRDNLVEASDQTYGILVLSSQSVVVRGNVLRGNDLGVALTAGSGNIVQLNNVTGNHGGVSVSGSLGNQVKDNLVRDGAEGVSLIQSTGNVLARNRVLNHSVDGVFLLNSTGNTVVENVVGFNNATGSSIGVRLQNSTGNVFYYNNFLNNSIQMFATRPPEDIAMNTWDDSGASRRGNFWSDYAGLDDGIGGRVAGDGVGDTDIPHPCPLGARPCSVSGPAGVDNYPLVSMWSAPSLNVTGVADVVSGVRPLTVRFSGFASGGVQPYVFRWDFDTGSTSNMQNATYTYQLSGSYVVSLTVSDDAGVSRTDFLAVAVLEPSFPPGQPGTGIQLLWLGLGVVLAAVAVLVLFVLRRRGLKGAPVKG